ncbi:hypothetical protein Thiosp_03731 [Thiorhodovibrio litoralis]|nr:hypothetical protein Thiosp_03731 [Thiorhodovibrio litoralis]
MVSWRHLLNVIATLSRRIIPPINAVVTWRSAAVGQVNTSAQIMNHQRMATMDGELAVGDPTPSTRPQRQFRITFIQDTFFRRHGSLIKND